MKQFEIEWRQTHESRIWWSQKSNYELRVLSVSPECLSVLGDLYFKATSNYIHAFTCECLIKDTNDVFFILVSSLPGTVPVHIRSPVNICWMIQLYLWSEKIICSVHNSLLKDPECGISHRISMSLYLAKYRMCSNA